MRSLTDLEANLFGISARDVPLVRVVDCQKLSDNGVCLMMIRTVPEYRKKLEERMITEDPSIAASPARLVALSTEPQELDRFDSGVCFLVQPSAESGELTATVVCRSDDYTRKISTQGTLVEGTLKKISKDEPETQFRVWQEGSIIRVVTLLVEGVKRTFYMTRSKIEWGRSKWINTPECPYVKEEFYAACKRQGIKQEDVEIPGFCFCFVLRSTWNQMKQEVEYPELVHFRTYTFIGEEYRQTIKTIPGAITPTTLTIEQAVRVILDGGVVITVKSSDNNLKIMTHDTALVYSWLETSAASSPEIQYFTLASHDVRDAMRFKSLLRGHAARTVNRTIETLDHNIAAAAEYLLHRLKLKLHSDAISKNLNKKQNASDQTKITAYNALKQDKQIENIIRSTQKAYALARQAAIDSGKFKPVLHMKARNGKQKKVTAKFYWGGSEAAEQKNQLDHIIATLNSYKEKDGKTLLQIIKKCSRCKKSEIAALKKLMKQSVPDVERPSTPTFDEKAQSEIEAAVANLHSIEINDDEVFIPDQSYCAQIPSDEEWYTDDTEDKTSRFQDDE